VQVRQPERKTALRVVPGFRVAVKRMGQAQLTASSQDAMVGALMRQSVGVRAVQGHMAKRQSRQTGMGSREKQYETNTHGGRHPLGLLGRRETGVEHAG
jgi:hypothetical protein